MYFSEAEKMRMKAAGWMHRRNYFYKTLSSTTLVIEYRNDKIFLNIYNNTTFNLIEERQTCESMAAALSQSKLLEKKYLIE